LNEILNSLFYGEQIETSSSILSQLFNRGGIESMLWSLSLAILALSLGGVLEFFGFAEVVVDHALNLIKRTFSLVCSTILGAFLCNVLLAENCLALSLGSRLYTKFYDKLSVDRCVLSRSIEDGATMTAALVPWNTTAIFYVYTLGVPVHDYLPYAVLNWLTALVSMLFAFVGWGMFRQSQTPKASTGLGTNEGFVNQ